MTAQQKQIILNQAKGSWQKEIVRELITHGEIYSPVAHLKGRDSKYQSKYQASFRNLLERLQNSGIQIKRIPGVCGGEWSAKYILPPITAETRENSLVYGRWATRTEEAAQNKKGGILKCSSNLTKRNFKSEISS